MDYRCPQDRREQPDYICPAAPGVRGGDGEERRRRERQEQPASESLAEWETSRDQEDDGCPQDWREQPDYECPGSRLEKALPPRAEEHVDEGPQERREPPDDRCPGSRLEKAPPPGAVELAVVGQSDPP